MTDREAIARALVDVTNRWIKPNFPEGHKLRGFDELDEQEQRLNLDYADAALGVMQAASPAQCGAGRTEFDAQGEPVRPWMWHFTARDQDALKLKVLDYIDRDNVFGDHFSENERNQIFTLLSAPWEPAEHWRERAEHAESVLEEQDRTSDDQDPPAKWLDGALRDLARELVADPKTPWIGERDPKQHICWTAADRLAARTPAACENQNRALHDLANVALEAVAHVGLANYREREEEANRWITDKLRELTDGGSND